MATQFKTNIDNKGNVHLPDENKDPKIIDKNGLLVIHPQITGDLDDAIRQNREIRITSEDMLK